MTPANLATFKRNRDRYIYDAASAAQNCAECEHPACIALRRIRSLFLCECGRDEHEHGPGCDCGSFRPAMRDPSKGE